MYMLIGYYVDYEHLVRSYVSKLSLLKIYVYVHMCVQVSLRTKKDLKPPGPGVTGNCELPDIGEGN